MNHNNQTAGCTMVNNYSARAANDGVFEMRRAA